MPSIEDIRALLAMPKKQQVACLRFWEHSDPLGFGVACYEIAAERERRDRRARA